jgi:hypothetical protein
VQKGEEATKKISASIDCVGKLLNSSPKAFNNTRRRNQQKGRRTRKGGLGVWCKKKGAVSGRDRVALLLFFFFVVIR